MGRATYCREELGKEVQAPSGYYTPLREETVDVGGRRLLYVLGSACIEASCCGVGSWEYVRVEGYLVEDPGDVQDGGRVQIDTVDDTQERLEIRRRLLHEYPRARVEFR